MRLFFYISLFLFLQALSFEALSQNPVPRIDTLADINIRKGYFEPVTITLGPCGESSSHNREVRLAYIVDGKVWKGSNISKIGIKNIASIDILKDPADAQEWDLPDDVTAVVFITTKKKQ